MGPPSYKGYRQRPADVESLLNESVSSDRWSRRHAKDDVLLPVARTPPDWKFKRMQHHMRWIEHSSKCTNILCKSYCAKIKDALKHLTECINQETCTTCQYTRSLCGFHSLNCTKAHCRVPFCMNIKYKHSVKIRQAKKPYSRRPLIRPLTTAASVSSLEASSTGSTIEEEAVVAQEELVYVSPASALKDAIRQLDALSLDVDAVKKPPAVQIVHKEVADDRSDQRGKDMLKVVQSLIDAMTSLMTPDQQQDMALKFLTLIPQHMISVLKSNARDPPASPTDSLGLFDFDC